MLEKTHIEISTGTIFRTLLIILGCWFLYLIRDIVALLFISLVIVSAIEPAVNWMHKKKIPRSFGVIIVYALLFSIMGLSISFLIPPLTEQFRDLYYKLPEYSQNIEQSLRGVKDYFQTQDNVLNIQNLIRQSTGSFSEISGNIFSRTVGVFSGFISTIVVFALVFYMAVKQDGINNFVALVIPEKHKDYALSLTSRIKMKIGKWMSGQLLLMISIFILYFIGLYFIGVPYALSLAIFAGLMEIIPYIGPIVSAIPAIILGLTISPMAGLVVLVLVFAIQQFENHIITPQIMKKALGLNPIAVILALLIGLKLGGVLGAILAIPIATAISVVMEDLMKKPDPRANSQ
jgi:predicted PurR-regulated permease PerM